MLMKMNGRRAREVCSTLTLASFAAMKRVFPTGGLQMLMARLQTTIIPKCNGSTPMCFPTATKYTSSYLFW